MGNAGFELEKGVGCSKDQDNSQVVQVLGDRFDRSFPEGLNHHGNGSKFSQSSSVYSSIVLAA